jgi:hypothetical protein
MSTGLDVTDERKGKRAVRHDHDRSAQGFIPPDRDFQDIFRSQKIWGSRRGQSGLREGKKQDADQGEKESEGGHGKLLVFQRWIWMCLLVFVIKRCLSWHFDN